MGPVHDRRLAAWPGAGWNRRGRKTSVLSHRSIKLLHKWFYLGGEKALYEVLSVKFPKKNTKARFSLLPTKRLSPPYHIHQETPPLPTLAQYFASNLKALWYRPSRQDPPISKEQRYSKRSGPFTLSLARALLAVMMVTLGNVNYAKLDGGLRAIRDNQ